MPLEIPGAHYVGNKACADCHAPIVRKFPTSPHARVHFEKRGDGRPNRLRILPRPRQQTHRIRRQREFHHQPAQRSGVVFSMSSRCPREFNLPQHHPVIEGRMSCVQCHDRTGGDIFKPAGGLAMARQNESCALCHREQTRPFVFGHEAMREGCVACHSPHGSINQKMLVESDPNLCLRCHAQVQGPNVASGSIYIGNTDHTAFFANRNLLDLGCHTAIHGSNVDPRLRY